MLFLQYCKERYQGKQSAEVKSALLLVFVLFWLGVVEAIFAAGSSTQLQVLYPLIYLCFIFLVCLRRFLYCLHAGHIHRYNGRISWKFDKNGEAEPAWGFLCTAYPGCFIAVHHTLWVMIGIITDPFWALPILTTILMLSFLFYVTSSLFFSYATWNKSHAINFTLFVVGGISIILVLFSFFLIGQQFFAENLISGAIQALLVVIINFFLKTFKKNKNNDSDEKNEDREYWGDSQGSMRHLDHTERSEEKINCQNSCNQTVA